MNRKILVPFLVLCLLVMGTIPVLAQGRQPVTTSANSPTAPVRPPSTNSVLWNQDVGTTGNAFASQYFTDYSMGGYTADDFVNAVPWSVTSIYIPGFYNLCGLGSADSLTWLVYPDNGGVPAGYPMDGSGTEVWSFSATPASTGITISPDGTSVTLDVVAATGLAIALPAGHYWISFFPSMSFTTCSQWFWMTSDTANGNYGQFIDPDGVFGSGCYAWCNHPSANSDVAFTLEGTAEGTNPTLHLNATRAYGQYGPPGRVKWVELVRVFDQNFAAVSGVLVSGEWTLPSGEVLHRDANWLTNVLGDTKFQLKAANPGLYQFCVTDMTLEGFVYDPLQNEVDPCQLFIVP